MGFWNRGHSQRDRAGPTPSMPVPIPTQQPAWGYAPQPGYYSSYGGYPSSYPPTMIPGAGAQVQPIVGPSSYIPRSSQLGQGYAVPSQPQVVVVRQPKSHSKHHSHHRHHHRSRRHSLSPPQTPIVLPYTPPQVIPQVYRVSGHVHIPTSPHVIPEHYVSPTQSYSPHSQQPVSYQHSPTPAYPPQSQQPVSYQQSPSPAYPSYQQQPISSQHSPSPSYPLYQQQPMSYQAQPSQTYRPQPHQSDAHYNSSSHHYPSHTQQPFSHQQAPPSAAESQSSNNLGAIGQAIINHFRYSRCTGRKKALCIGINYLGQHDELRGCINDARHVRDFLVKYHNYEERDIIVLTDDSHNPKNMPNKANILSAMKWLVRTAKCDDSLFFHYSGHGGQKPDQNGDEVDGYDEVIYPVDFKKNGDISDDVMHDIMIKGLPEGCRLTALFDCCHSGTVLDLPYVYSAQGRRSGHDITEKARRRLACPADLISISGCHDDQTSADTFQGGVAVGATSYAFIKSLKNNPRQSYSQLLQSLQQILHEKYGQTPQIGSSHHIDLNKPFIL